MWQERLWTLRELGILKSLLDINFLPNNLQMHRNTCFDHSTGQHMNSTDPSQSCASICPWGFMQNCLISAIIFFMAKESWKEWTLMNQKLFWRCLSCAAKKLRRFLFGIVVSKSSETLLQHPTALTKYGAPNNSPIPHHHRVVLKVPTVISKFCTHQHLVFPFRHYFDNIEHSHQNVPREEF